MPKFANLIATKNPAGPADLPSGSSALPLRAREPSFHALGKAYAFLFGNRPENCDDRFSKNTARIKIGFTEGAIPDAIASESVQVLKRRQCTFTGESVQAPKQHNVKFSLRCVFEQSAEVWPAAILAALVVDVFVAHVPTLGCCKTSEFCQLVVGVLPTVGSADARIESGNHCLDSLSGRVGFFLVGLRPFSPWLLRAPPLYNTDLLRSRII